MNWNHVMDQNECSAVKVIRVNKNDEETIIVMNNLYGQDLPIEDGLKTYKMDTNSK